MTFLFRILCPNLCPLARLLLFALVTILGCSQQPKKESQFSVRDTVEFYSMLEKGKKGILFIDNQIIDTIDIDFGYHPFKGGVIFLAVDKYNDSTFFKTDYIYWNNNTRQFFKTILPDFNDNFSSPAVIDSYFVYWGLKPVPQTADYQIFAARYNLQSSQLDTILLSQESILTDFRFYFTPPFIEQGMFQFPCDNRVWKVSPDWKTITKENISIPDSLKQKNVQTQTYLDKYFTPLEYYGKKNQNRNNRA
jgi:hypothetical protein